MFVTVQKLSSPCVEAADERAYADPSHLVDRDAGLHDSLDHADVRTASGATPTENKAN